MGVPPSPGPNEQAISQKNSVGPSRQRAWNNFPSCPPPWWQPWVAPTSKNKDRNRKKAKSTKKHWNREWIQRRCEPVWASSPFTIKLSLSIKHADIPLGFAEATSRTVFHSLYRSLIQMVVSTLKCPPIWIKRVQFMVWMIQYTKGR